MANRVILGLAALVAIVGAFAPDLGGGALSIVLVVLGVVYGAIAVDAEDAGSFLLLAVAAGVAGSAGGLDGIPAIGGYLDSIVDGLATALAAGTATVLVMWVVNRLKG